jgi:choline dehydrogenase-like flavoprotein
VYVTGGALWPRSGSWNPTLTMVALSQKLAQNLVPEKNRDNTHTIVRTDGRPAPILKDAPSLTQTGKARTDI